MAKKLTKKEREARHARLEEQSRQRLNSMLTNTVKAEYTHAHMENAMMLIEHLTVTGANRAQRGDMFGPWIEALGGSAGMRDYVAQVAVEIERQFTGIGLKWDEDADWYDLCDRVADAIMARPLVAPAVLVADVFSTELKIVFKAETKEGE